MCNNFAVVWYCPNVVHAPNVCEKLFLERVLELTSKQLHRNVYFVYFMGRYTITSYICVLNVFEITCIHFVCKNNYKNISCRYHIALNILQVYMSDILIPVSVLNERVFCSTGGQIKFYSSHID